MEKVALALALPSDFAAPSRVKSLIGFITERYASVHVDPSRVRFVRSQRARAKCFRWFYRTAGFGAWRDVQAVACSYEHLR